MLNMLKISKLFKILKLIDCLKYKFVILVNKDKFNYQAIKRLKLI